MFINTYLKLTSYAEERKEYGRRLKTNLKKEDIKTVIHIVLLQYLVDLLFLNVLLFEISLFENIIIG